MFWPSPSPTSAFQARRESLGRRFEAPALFVSGLARPRNFAGNRYPFRAESHFLYFAGEPIEGAALLVSGNRSTLYAPSPDREISTAAGTSAQAAASAYAAASSRQVPPSKSQTSRRQLLSGNVT